jgi:hypothetical protein
MSRPGTGDRAAVADLLALFERRDAPALAASLERWLARGDAAHETLRDFIFELDRKPFEELATIKSYQISFAIIHPVMLREAETARFIHYFLAATRNVPSSAARVLILEWAPVFVRYHGARFADLRDFFEHIVLDGLSAGGEGLPRTYMIMKTLGFIPPIEMIEEQLGKARTVAEIDPLADHLISRNDRDAVRALDRTLSREAAFQDQGAAAMLGALARMTTPEAELALLRYFHSGHAQKRDAAALAYFAVDRGSLGFDLALEYLNSPSGVKEKSHWILRMRQLNPGLVETLRAEADRISIEPIRKALRDSPDPRPASPVR